jgi:hypothetical protein
MSIFVDHPTMSDVIQGKDVVAIVTSASAASYPPPLVLHTNVGSYISADDPSSNEGSITFGAFRTNRKGQREYDIIISRLLDLLHHEEQDDEEEDEYGALFPTSYALERALSLLTQTYQLVGNFFTRAAVTTSFEGGIRIQWIHPHASVRLVIPANQDGQEYIYFEAGDEYGTEDVSSLNLAKRLVWLQHSARHA